MAVSRFEMMRLVMHGETKLSGAARFFFETADEPDVLAAPFEHDMSVAELGMGLLWRFSFAVGLVWFFSHGANFTVVEALRFELDTARECWVHEVPSDGELVHVSFVVIAVRNFWGLHHRRAANAGVDVTITDPGGHEVHTIKQKTQGKYNVTATHKGPYKFCFQNRVSLLQTIDFNVHIGRLSPHEPIKDEHLYALMAQIARVQDALFDVQFEQHWLHSQTARQAQVASDTSRRVLYKAAAESLSLVACSVLQIVLLQRLFEKKLGVCPPRV